jgi:RNA recognition motif-containing protein
MGRIELFVGNLNRDVDRKDIEDVFKKYGRILRCDLKNRGKSRVFLQGGGGEGLDFYLKSGFSNRLKLMDFKYFSRLRTGILLLGIRRGTRR